ncbi:DNA-binding protein [Streptomyces sp. NPDC127098]|uniref:DNA-binding protein n=1 Tax=Streptomyces sp. NPDC127098 TaxID=3347137 RepID=UPI003666FEAD
MKGTLVLDSAGLSGHLAGDRKTMLIIEVQHKGGSRPRMDWVLSRMRVHDITKETARAAAGLLQEAGLHGHTYAIDAMVAELALRQPPPVSLLTSDGDGMARLCGRRVRPITI